MKPHRIQTRHRIKKGRSGFSMIDSMVTMTILTLAVGGMCASVIASMQLSRVNQEKAIAVHAANAMVEQLQAMQFDEIFAIYNSAGADDPDGADTSPGDDFAVAGLRTQSNDGDGFAGEIEFPTSVDGSGKLILREDLNDPNLGLPRDLNGDGVIDSLDHSGDYVLLPVRIRVSWRGAGGNSRIAFEALLID